MKIFMYPIENSRKSATQNPYIQDTINALKNAFHTIVNENNPTNYGLLNLIPSLHKVDVFYFNWVEDVSEKRFGFLQNIVLFLLIPLLKFLDKKIIWIMHNKISHSKKNRLLKIINFYFLVNHSDIVVTHSHDGVLFGKSFLKSEKKLFFIHHPVKILNHTIQPYEHEYDLLIWGSITPYKGILEFLQACEHTVLKKYKICIAGKISDDKLKNQLEYYISENVSIFNTFISDDELDILFQKSKIVLFTYSGFSTLSSGALMHSLERNCKIIGPDIGAFKDLADEGIIKTFTSFEKLPSVIEKSMHGILDQTSKKENFINQNTWNNYGQFISNLLSQQ